MTLFSVIKLVVLALIDGIGEDVVVEVLWLTASVVVGVEEDRLSKICSLRLKTMPFFPLHPVAA